MTPIPARGSCPKCHAGPYSLKTEAVNANGGAMHTSLADDANVTVCLTCHGPEPSIISMRQILHPVHTGSKIFYRELNGNCFSCHNVSADGTFQILSDGRD